MKRRRLIFLVTTMAVVLAFMAMFTSKATNAISTKSFGFGFKKSVNGESASIDQEGFKEILQKHGAIFLGDTSKKELYLTFNNGYENGQTAKILDVLKAKNVPAAFFVTGHYAKGQPDLIKRMVDEGHLVGNHSWSHPDMARISKESIKKELDLLKSTVADITGQQNMPFARPPSGTFNELVLAYSKELGYTNVFFSIAYRDWDENAVKGARYAHDQVISQLHPGAVIMLHTVLKDNAEAMASIIDSARELGYEFKSLEQLKVKNY